MIKSGFKRLLKKHYAPSVMYKYLDRVFKFTWNKINWKKKNNIARVTHIFYIYQKAVSRFDYFLELKIKKPINRFEFI